MKPTKCIDKSTTFFENQTIKKISILKKKSYNETICNKNVFIHFILFSLILYHLLLLLLISSKLKLFRMVSLTLGKKIEMWTNLRLSLFQCSQYDKSIMKYVVIGGNRTRINLITVSWTYKMRRHQFPELHQLRFFRIEKEML